MKQKEEYILGDCCDAPFIVLIAMDQKTLSSYPFPQLEGGQTKLISNKQKNEHYLQ